MGKRLGIPRPTRSTIERAFAALSICLIFYFGWIPTPTWLDIAFIMLATAAAWAFCFIYALMSHGAWIRTRYGRHLMVLTLMLALLGTHSLARSAFPDPWPAWMGSHDFHREVIYGVLAYQLINRCILVVVSQVKGEKRRLAELTRPTRPIGEPHTHLTEHYPKG